MRCFSDRLMMEEDRRDEFCGNTAWLTEGRGDGAPGIAASPHALLCMEWDVCCVLVWDAWPL